MHMCFVLFFTYTHPYISSCFHKLFYEHKDRKNSYPDFDFERSSYIGEKDFEKDTDDPNLPPKMLRLLSLEDKLILPHQEVIEVLNLGADDEKNEV